MIKHSRRTARRPIRRVRVAASDLQDVADGYYETDLAGTLIAVNPGLCQMLACLDPAQLSGEEPLDLIDAATRERLTQVFRRVRETGDPVQGIECPITRADGVARTLELSIALRRSASGTPLGFRGIVRDVTERAQAATALKQRMSQLSLLQQLDQELNQTLVLESVLEMALNAALLLCSAEAGFLGLIEHERIHLVRSVGGFPDSWIPLEVGIAARVIRNQRAEMVCNVESDPDYYPDLAATRAEIALPLIVRGKVIGVLNLETADPEHFTAEVFEAAQLLAARVAATVENARVYEALQAQLAETQSRYQQVSELEELKTQMIRIAAHDLRGPLSIVGSYIELLDEDLAASYGELDGMYVNAIRQAVARMTQMTADILSVERLHEHLDVTLTRVQLGALLEHTVEEFADENRLHTQEVRLKADPLSVYGDSAELHEALINLFGNATKYTPDGGVIEARVERDGEFALLEIIDSGYGIPADQQGELFQPFRRVKTRETYAIDGTGLGLYLVKKIVERHGGTIHFQSEQGKGSLFGFRLPLAKSSD